MLADPEQQNLLHRVREQEGVIQKLWDQYTRDVGKEPEIGEVIGRQDQYVPAKKQLVLNALQKNATFEEAVEMFDFKPTHRYAEYTAQRVASRLMHSRQPAVVAREAGDVVFEGFWGRGVSMPPFEKLLAKLRGIKHGSFRRVSFSDNGFNGNFVPGVIEIMRRGAHRLDLSHNNIESAAMQQLCNSLPSAAQYLEALDLRFNPCCNDGAFAFCIADVIPSMKFLHALSVTVRCPTDKAASKVDTFGARGSTSQSRIATPQRGRSASQGRAKSPQARGKSPQARGKSLSGSRASWHIHSGARGDPGTGSATGRTVAGKEGAIALFRAVAQSPQLKMLDLRSSSLSKTAVQRLAQILRGDQLTHLGLADCFLGDAIEPILNILGTCRNLVYISLRLNCINDGLSLELCRALDESASLTEVDLSSNELGDNFGQAFAKVLRLNETLWKVDLTRNLLGVRSGEALLEVMTKKNTTLVSIGDTVDGLFGLGLQVRYQIQCHLDSNKKGLVPGFDPSKESMNPELTDIEFTILDDEPAVPHPWTILV
eukprot:gnl/MRDRNA2_/MRDRNA2_36110_c0_seq1.p1 gnl/MRDRNA2_/MRDRNA2_36110_c0~~gnl/MRDRNA2_/MRDRNA2_36110_c0_seq1.p1  ORF type:complete len:542 (-),score=103.43 gnl/MRDRNA2_/MRDRNA2_36110_c0_seq1:258-1883(-)